MQSTTMSAVDHGHQPPELLTALLSRSATDLSFRRKLLSQPRAAVAEFHGKDISAIADANIVFIENAGDATLVLPPFIDGAHELSDRDLEVVAGGTDPLSIVVTVIASAVITHQAGWW